MRYLRELVLPHPAQKLILEEYIQRIDMSYVGCSVEHRPALATQTKG